MNHFAFINNSSTDLQERERKLDLLEIPKLEMTGSLVTVQSDFVLQKLCGSKGITVELEGLLIAAFPVLLMGSLRP